MKIRIIKEKGVYRIQKFFNNLNWEYAKKSIKDSGSYCSVPIEFQNQKEAEDYVENNFIIKTVKEYKVEDK